MSIGAARAAAADWVKHHAGAVTGFKGAYFSGSTVGLPDDAELAPGSDIDIVVVIELEEPPLKPGKFVYCDTLLEVTYLSWRELDTAEKVLGSYHLAGSFRTDTIIADPSGQLGLVQAQVGRHFADRIWVERRCGQVYDKIESGLRSLDFTAPLHDLITSCLFPAGVTTHALLVAALRNPTVRLRYLAAWNVLEEYGRLELYPELLSLLGCGHWDPQQAEQHLQALARTFDAAASAARTPFFFSSDVTAAARPIAIDGSRELIRAGCHREAVFWMAATFARCHKILAADAPELQRAHAPAFEALVADLGLASTEAIARRAEDVLAFLPRLRDTAEAILLANPDIR